MKRLELPPRVNPRPDAGDGGSFLDDLEAARAGEMAALERLFRSFYPRVRRMVHHSLATDLRTNRPWLSARFSTGDVVQEVFRSVLSDLDGFGGRTEDAFTGYLSMVVRNRILDAIRFHEAARRDGRRASGDVDDAGLAAPVDDPAEVMASEEDLVRFHEAVNELPEKERLLLRARLEQTASFHELAQRLGYGSTSAARRAFYAAQAKLAVRLGRS